MHVAIDGVGNHSGGGWAVLTRTVAELTTDPRVGRITVFCSPLRLAPTAPPDHPRVQWRERPDEHHPAARVGWYARGLDAETRRVAADVVLAMNAAGQTRQPRVALVQQAFLVHGDLRAMRPHRFAARMAVMRALARRAVASARRIVVQTSWMRARVWEAWGRDTTVVALGLPRPRPRAEQGRAPALVAVVGSDLPYKRRDLALRAAELARQRVGALELTSVIDRHPASVFALLERAAVLLQTSDVEAFGLPVVEAFATGCPVVAPDLPWARAVADDAALYFDPGSASSAARRLIDALTLDGLLDELRERGSRRLQDLWTQAPYRTLVDVLGEVA